MEKHYSKYSKEERKQYYLDKLKEVVDNHGGTFDSTNYERVKSKIKFTCKEGHVWWAQVGQIIKGGWCRKCWNIFSAGKYLKIENGLEKAKEVAISKGGACLSLTYENNHSHMLWKCSNEHEWKAAFTDIKRGSWCPTCSQGTKERVVRYYFEAITGKKFPKKRPSWLLNDNGSKLELDGFCEELNLAFEYHGEQHYLENNFFGNLQTRMQNDEIKRKRCIDHNVILIEIPYTVETEDLSREIRKQLLEHNFSNLIEESDIVHTNFIPSNQLKELHDLAGSKGGKCLTNIYLGVNKKHEFICKEGHTWKATPANMKYSNTWCNLCSYQDLSNTMRKYSTEFWQDFAKTKGGKFLSNQFESVNHKYRWKCSAGHEWLTTPSNVLKGQWCKSCSFNNRKLTIQQMQEIAISRNGKCLSSEYYDSQTKLLWECKKGHTWLAKPNSIMGSKSWCPKCKNKKGS